MDVHIEYENWNYPQLDPSEDKHIAGPMTAVQGQWLHYCMTMASPWPGPLYYSSVPTTSGPLHCSSGLLDCSGVGSGGAAVSPEPPRGHQPQRDPPPRAARAHGGAACNMCGEIRSVLQFWHREASGSMCQSLVFSLILVLHLMSASEGAGLQVVVWAGAELISIMRTGLNKHQTPDQRRRQQKFTEHNECHGIYLLRH